MSQKKTKPAGLPPTLYNLGLCHSVVPIDSAAPKGRLILPQQQTIRDLLEAGAISIVVRESELAKTLAKLDRRPDLVITDSQAFQEVASIVPNDIPLTSFPFYLPDIKGIWNFWPLAQKPLISGRRRPYLISEGCTHHRQCEDIGTVKLPRWIRTHTGKELSLIYQRHRIPAESPALPPHHPLRRLHP